MASAWIEQAQASLAEAFARRLHARAGSIFRAAGEAACRDLAAAAFSALREDLATGKNEAIRAAMSALCHEQTFRGLSFSDLRYHAQSLRALVLTSIEGPPALDTSQRRRIDDWLHEVVLVGTMRFVALYEERAQERAARQEVQQLEQQLGEVKAAFEEKARLLEVIRQASTPIAPVFDGILVVPLVGVFDAFRAQILTEKLLRGVVHAQAQVVILDISGVPVFDAEAAQLVIRLTQAVRLLGAEMILVGMSSAVARAIVEIGVDLSGLKTLGTLQDGLAQALAARRLRIAPLPRP